MPPISTKQTTTFQLNNATNINKTKESLNSDGQQCLQNQQNKQLPFSSKHCTRKDHDIFRHKIKQTF